MKKIACVLIACMMLALCAACADKEPAQLPEVTVAPVAENAPEQSAAPAGEQAADYVQLAILLAQISTDYQPGSAGCSLRAIKIAGQILDWYAASGTDASMLTQTMQLAVAALPPETAASYGEEFEGVYAAAIELTKDYALDQLETAGYTPSAYPYSGESVETLFTALREGLPAEYVGFLREVVDPAQPIELDLDNDGVMEKVTIAVDEDAYVTDITFAGATQTYTDHIDMALSFIRAYVGDGWQCDGSQALFISGDEASNDYMTYIYRLYGGKLQRGEIYGSLLDANSQGVITMERPIDVFGTYSGVCQFQKNDDFTFSLCSPYRVQNYADRWADRKITIICDSLPVILQDGTSEAATLPKGTELMLRETDQESYAVLEDANGEAYRVDIERHDDDWQWYLNGVPESECFTPLLYAG